MIIKSDRVFFSHNHLTIIFFMYSFIYSMANDHPQMCVYIMDGSINIIFRYIYETGIHKWLGFVELLDKRNPLSLSLSFPLIQYYLILIGSYSCFFIKNLFKKKSLPFTVEIHSLRFIVFFSGSMAWWLYSYWSFWRGNFFSY